MHPLHDHERSIGLTLELKSVCLLMQQIKIIRMVSIMIMYNYDDTADRVGLRDLLLVSLVPRAGHESLNISVS